MSTDKIRRNDPCPCGSGKKYKRCCISKLYRTHSILVGCKQRLKGVKVENGKIVGGISLSGESIKPEAMFTETSYTRQSGREKVLNLIPDVGTINTTLHLASEFGAIFAIDTNTKQIENDKISIGIAIECYGKAIDQHNIQFSFRKYAIIYFKNCPDGLAEKYSWARLIRMIASSPNYSPSLKIAIITDHDKDKHPKYNAREWSILKSFYLPENFSLLYASSDVGKENIMNVLIGKCESEVKTILDQLKKQRSAVIGNFTLFCDKISAPDLHGFKRGRGAC